MEILRRHDNTVIFSDDKINSIKELVELAVKNGINLSYANLSHADLSYANLSYADLSHADLSHADLSHADLSFVNFSHANLSFVNLSYADLRDVIGNKQEITTLQTSRYIINYTNTIIQIGCKNTSIEDWFSFSDRDILAMDGKEALVWWKKWKPILMILTNN